MNKQVKTWLGMTAGILVLGLLSWLAWNEYSGASWDKGLAGGNGRIEATEIDIAAKSAGRVQEILVNEGDYVTADQVVARIDTDVLEAQLHQAEAELREAESSVTTAQSQVILRGAEKAAAEAVLAQREAELNVAQKHYDRTERLTRKGAASEQDLDDDSARREGAAAAVAAAKAQVAATEAAIATAKAELTGAEAAVAAERANIASIRADLDDSILRAPRDGRVQYRVAELGEVVAAGGRVVNMIDLSDVYMTFFLPTAQVGRLALGDEVRLVLDAAPQRVIPASVTFVADVAQFTPKTVETAVEREKLMFRVKAQIPADLLKKHITHVKTGLPGMAYARLDPGTPWPERLSLMPPQ
jgi:HlyD family secretion protein